VTRFSSHVRAEFYCEHNKHEHRDPKHVLLSLAYQLALHWPPYREVMLRIHREGKLADLAKESKAEVLWSRVLSAPLSEIKMSAQDACRKQVVLLLDALDESEAQGSNALLTMLGDCLRSDHTSLPAWVGIAVSSRPETPIMEKLKNCNPLKLSCDDARNQDDLKVFVRHKLGQPPHSLLGQGAAFDAAVALVFDNAKGLFLYASKVLSLENPLHTLEDVQRLPKGLDGFYAETFLRLCPRKEYRPKLQESVAHAPKMITDLTEGLREEMKMSHEHAEPTPTLVRVAKSPKARGYRLGEA
jgi:hypothetical protein